MSSSDVALSLSALGAAFELRTYVRAHPDVSTDAAVESLCALKSSASNLDFRTGIQIHSLLPGELALDISRSGIRETVRAILDIQPPNWMKLIPYGRDRVRTVLHRDEIQCLREAGLFDAIPDEDALSWWDTLAARQRAASQSAIMEQAREAERLSMAIESDRLEALGTELRPEWVSLEDNSLGYDIRSFALTEGLFAPRMIEVKSTKDGSIYVTRNEWNNAVTSSNYLFHVWSFPERIMQELQVADVEQHIPTDSGNGQWESVRVVVE